MNLFALFLVVLLWLPGRVAFELAAPRDSQIRGWPLGERLFLDVSLSSTYVLWMGLVLAQVGRFSAAALSVACLVPVAALLVVFPRARRAVIPSTPPRPDLTLAVALVLVVAGSMIYAPDFEQVIGGRDPVAYVVGGAHIGLEGSFAVDDQFAASVPEAARGAFLGPDYRPERAHYGPRFLGWYLEDPETGRVVPHGLALYPSALAVGYLAGGIRGLLRTTEWLALWAAVALFFLGRRAFGFAVGLTAAAWFLVSAPQVWFSRYTTSEMVAQPLVVVGLYAFLVFRRQRIALFGVLAAVALGLSLQAHIWMGILGLPLFGLLVVDLARGRLDELDLRAFWLPLFVLALHALYQVFWVSWPYTADALRVLRQSPWIFWLLGPVVAATPLVAWFWGRRVRSRHEGSGAHDGADSRHGSTSMWFRWLLAMAVVLLAGYAYFLRPNQLVAWRSLAVPNLAMGATGLALALAVVGFALLLIDRRRDEATLMLMGIVAGAGVPVLVEPMIGLDLMWALRRDLPVVIPAVYLFGAVAVWWLADRASGGVDGGAGESPEERGLDGSKWAGRRGLALGACVAVALVVTGVVAARGWTYRGFEQPGDAVAKVEEIAASLEDDAVLIFEARSDWRVSDFAAALAYWKGFDVVWTRNRAVDPVALRELVWPQLQAGRPVYFFTQGFNYHLPDVTLVPHRQWWFNRQEMEWVIGGIPRELWRSRFPFTTYRLVAGAADEDLGGVLDVGEWDDNYVGEMLPRELSGERTLRWTKGTSFAWLPGLDATATELEVTAWTQIDLDAPPRTLRATLDGAELGELVLGRQWTDYVFPIPGDWVPNPDGLPKLTLETQVFQPSEMGDSEDTRYLGILIDTIVWR